MFSLFQQKLTPAKAIGAIIAAIIIGILVNCYNTKELKKTCEKHAESARKTMELRQLSGLDKEELVERLKNLETDTNRRKNVIVYIDKAYNYPKLSSESEINEAKEKFAHEVYDLCYAKDSKVYE